MFDFKDLEKNFTKQDIFYVTADKDDTVLVAFNVFFDSNGFCLRWFDTVKGRIKCAAKIIDIKSDSFIFEDTGGVVYTFQKMTLEIFNQYVQPKLYNAKVCQTEEEMRGGLYAYLKNVY